MELFDINSFQFETNFSNTFSYDELLHIISNLLCPNYKSNKKHLVFCLLQKNEVTQLSIILFESFCLLGFHVKLCSRICDFYTVTQLR